MTVSMPARAAAALRPSASPGLLLISAVTAATFTATPFAISEAIDEYGVSTGVAALVSTAQMLGFALGNLAGGRVVKPSARTTRGAIIVLALAGLASAGAPWFWGLVALRGVAGIAMGILVWIAWADSASNLSKRGEIAATGPIAAALTAPLLGLAAHEAGLTGLYAVLAAAAALSLLPSLEVDTALPTKRRPIAAKGLRPTLVALLMFTAGGSAIFIFAEVIAVGETSMSPAVLALALSVNALLGIPGARYSGRRRLPGLWMALTGTCALVLATSSVAWVTFVAISVWGLAFWVAVPEVFSLLSDRSVHPADRVGDAQFLMSIGRVVGPTMGGALIGAGSNLMLGLVGFATMAGAGLIVEVSARRHSAV